VSQAASFVFCIERLLRCDAPDLLRDFKRVEMRLMRLVDTIGEGSADIRLDSVRRVFEISRGCLGRSSEICRFIPPVWERFLIADAVHGCTDCRLTITSTKVQLWEDRLP